MKKIPAGLILATLTALATTALATAAFAQTAAPARTAAPPPKYDLAREIAVEGTVSRVFARPARTMLAGAHVLVKTPSGTVDAHLGPYAMKGSSALTLSVGDHVRVVGVLTTIQGGPILLVRTVQTAAGTTAVRNEHGIPLQSPSASATRSRQKTQGGRS